MDTEDDVKAGEESSLKGSGRATHTKPFHPYFTTSKWSLSKAVEYAIMIISVEWSLFYKRGKSEHLPFLSAEGGHKNEYPEESRGLPFANRRGCSILRHLWWAKMGR